MQERIMGTVFDIQRWSLHDGPGIRTNVFLKGCPLRCIWCSNPESQEVHPEVAFFADKCISCGRCVSNCPYGAVNLGGGKHTINYNLCWSHCYYKKGTETYPCTTKCYAKAMEQLGKAYTVEDVIAEVMRDALIYEQSGGGVTITGGEPTSQPDFLRALLQSCKENGLHTVMETCAYVGWGVFEKVLPSVDFVFVDIKLCNPQKHEQYTGVDNALILQNCIALNKYAAEHAMQLVVRTPVIPGINDSEAEIVSIAEFIKENMPAVNIYELLPYHRLGRGKYQNIGKEYSLLDLEPPAEEKMRKLRSVVARYNFADSYE